MDGISLIAVEINKNRIKQKLQRVETKRSTN